MVIEKDILLDENDDLLIQNGDFVISEADYQHIKNILIADKGWWKMVPFLGANVPANLKGFFDNKQIQKIRLNLEADNFKVKKVIVKNGNLEIEASR